MDDPGRITFLEKSAKPQEINKIKIVLRQILVCARSLSRVVASYLAGRLVHWTNYDVPKPINGPWCEPIEVTT